GGWGRGHVWGGGGPGAPPGGAGALPPRASFSSQLASLAVPLPAGPHEPGWARGVAQRQLRLPPPDVPTRSAAGSRSAQASRRIRYRAGPRADRACDSSAPTRSFVPPLGFGPRGPSPRPPDPT